MTLALFRADAYLREAPAVVTAVNDRGGVILDQSLFYPTGGGQPGDGGQLHWDGGALDVATTVKGESDQIVLVPTAVSQHNTLTRQWEYVFSMRDESSYLDVPRVETDAEVVMAAIGNKGRMDEMRAFFEGVGHEDTAGVWEGDPNLRPDFRAQHQKKLDKQARAAKAAEMI